MSGLIIAGFLVALVILGLSLSDPRWAIAVCPVLSVFGAKELVPLVWGQHLIWDQLVPLLVFWVVVPAGVILLARRVRCRAARA